MSVLLQVLLIAIRASAVWLGLILFARIVSKLADRKPRRVGQTYEHENEVVLLNK